MAQTTRLKESDREQAVVYLQKTLDNIIKFHKCPLTDASGLIAMWNSLHDPAVVASFSDLVARGYPMSNNFAISNVRFTVPVGDKGACLTTLFRLETMTNEQGFLAWKFANNTTSYTSATKEVRIPFTSSRNRSTVVDRETVIKFLGNEAEATLDWMANCALYIDEVKEARTVIGDIFEMTETADQLKRMVPDLLQYLPEAVRRAYEEQKRASSLPFNWAAYDKRSVDRMILAVSKGHLLSNIRTNNDNIGYENVAATTWCFHGDIVSD
jgi:hypothetical protein